MKAWYRVTVTAEQRLTLGMGGERAYLTHSHPFIPGSVMRGALAASWMAGGGQRDSSFRRTFELGRFGPAFPHSIGVDWQSVRKCKYHREGGHELFHDEALLGPLAVGERGCHGYVPLSGGYSGGNLVTETTTAMSPRRHVADDSKLFAREAIERLETSPADGMQRKTMFVGHLVMPAGDNTRLASIDTAYLGGRGSVRGRATLAIEPVERPLPQMEGDLLLLRTLSPAILVDAAGAPSDDFRAAIEGLGIEVVRHWAHRVNGDAAGGWHNASGLPKPTEIAIAPGAVAVVRWPSNAILIGLLDGGLGLRTSEGYGWIEAATPTSAAVAPITLPQTRTPKRRTRSSEPAQRDYALIVQQLKLTHDQRQWLAKKLYGHPTGHDLGPEEIAEPVVGRLSSTQGTEVRRIVREVPQDLRNSLAHAITKGHRT